MWLVLALCSALFLGTYDVFKKVSLQNNAVIPVLLSSILCSSAILLPFVLMSRLFPNLIEGSIFFVPQVDLRTHLFLILKSFIVLSSWLFAYFAMKHLPISLASPIKATQPVWTVIGALLIFGEKLNAYQAAGVGITLLSFFMFSVVGKKEGISLKTNKWFWFIIMATLTGAISALYDKYLMKQFNAMAVQTYYTFYQGVIMSVITLFLWFPTKNKTTPFQFRWSIVFISIFLVTADFIYFYALTLPGALIAVVSTIRRAGVIVPFLYGAIIMQDKNIKLKIIDLLGVLLGMLLLFLGSK
jgi:bacterial/archaeal transporter family protein